MLSKNNAIIDRDNVMADKDFTNLGIGVIFGKITPISDSNEMDKPYRDSSEMYKMFPPGVMDRVYIDIQNQDGYLIRKASIRSNRSSRIGDMYCERKIENY